MLKLYQVKEAMKEITQEFEDDESILYWQPLLLKYKITKSKLKYWMDTRGHVFDETVEYLNEIAEGRIINALLSDDRKNINGLKFFLQSKEGWMVETDRRKYDLFEKAVPEKITIGFE